MGGNRVEATWSNPGAGEQRWFLGTLATIRVPGEAVDGRFALIEFLFPSTHRLLGIPTHRMRAMSCSMVN